MTERHEVISLYSQLFDVEEETRYESSGKPGNGHDIDLMLLEAADKMREALELLKLADGAMAAQGQEIFCQFECARPPYNQITTDLKE